MSKSDTGKTQEMQYEELLQPLLICLRNTGRLDEFLDAETEEQRRAIVISVSPEALIKSIEENAAVHGFNRGIDLEALHGMGEEGYHDLIGYGPTHDKGYAEEAPPVENMQKNRELIAHQLGRRGRKELLRAETDEARVAIIERAITPEYYKKLQGDDGIDMKQLLDTAKSMQGNQATVGSDWSGHGQPPPRRVPPPRAS